MRLYQVLIAVDQFFNTLTGGWADETLSSRAYRLKHRMPFTFYRWLIDVLFWFDKDHCKESYLSEIHRRQYPPELRA